MKIAISEAGTLMLERAGKLKHFLSDQYGKATCWMAGRNYSAKECAKRFGGSVMPGYMLLMPELPEKKYYRVDEVAVYYNLSPRVIYQLIAEGRVIAIQPAGCRALRISREEVEKMKIPVGEE